MLKIVVDTNVWISALLGGRSVIPVLEAWKAKKFKVIISPPLIDELVEVCHRPKLKKHINPDHANSLIKQLYWRGYMVIPTTIPPFCRDPKDHPVLATAIDGKADAVVSGDNDLKDDKQLRLFMETYRIRILSVKQLLEL